MGPRVRKGAGQIVIPTPPVIPAKAGIQVPRSADASGMTAELVCDQRHPSPAINRNARTPGRKK